MALANLTEELIYSVRDGVATLIFNRPDKMNACTTTMYDGICQVADEVTADDNVKVLVITGAGRAFCAGTDVESRLATRVGGGRLEKSRREMIQPVGYFGSALHRLGKPTIAAINGVAVGAGLSWALLCDIRIASDKARLGAVWVNMGLIPDVGGTYLLPRTIGLDKAIELAITGDIIDAKEAERIGLVTKVVPHDDLVQVTNELASRIARGPSVAIELIKRGIYRAIGGDYDAQLDFESYAQNLCFQTEDCKEAVNAFKEKRQPHFQGK